MVRRFVAQGVSVTFTSAKNAQSALRYKRGARMIAYSGVVATLLACNQPSWHHDKQAVRFLCSFLLKACFALSDDQYKRISISFFMVHLSRVLLWNIVCRCTRPFATPSSVTNCLCWAGLQHFPPAIAMHGILWNDDELSRQ